MRSDSRLVAAVGTAALAFAAFVAAGPAEAVPTYTFTPCDQLTPDVSGAVDNAAACEAIRWADTTNTTPINDSEAVVNNEPLGDAWLGMFGLESWVLIARDNVDDPETDGPEFLTGGTLAQSGAYDLGLVETALSIDLWDTYGSLALVFKSGSNTLPSCLIAYRLLPGTMTGDYVTPFECEQSGDPRDISHVTLYASGESTTVVPVPAAAPLLLTAAAGLAALRRRRRAAA